MSRTRITSLLGALQLADSFFPSGLYTLSHGLESFTQRGGVKIPEQLEDLIEDYLTAVAGSTDAVGAAQAARFAVNAATIAEIDRRLYSTRLAHEAAASSVRAGRQLLATAQGLCSNPSLERYVELYSLTTGLLGAALRTMRVGHTQVQGILRRLAPVISALAQQAARTPYEDLWASAPAIEIMQMRHERAEVRLFAS